MKKEKIKVLGVEVDYEVTENATEFNTLAKAAAGEDRCHALALKQVLYHVSYGNIRGSVAEFLEKEGHGTRKLYAGKAGVGKEVTKHKTGDGEDAKTEYKDSKGKVVDTEKISITTESEGDFFKRVCAEKGVTAESFKELIQRAADANKFDPSARERTAGEKTLAKTWLKMAEQVFAAGAQDGVKAQLEGDLGREIDLSDESTRITVLAQAISDNEARERELRQNKYLAMGGKAA